MCERENASFRSSSQGQDDAVRVAFDLGCDSSAATVAEGADQGDCRACSGVGTALVGRNMSLGFWQDVPPFALAGPFLPEPPLDALLRPPLVART